MKKINLIILSLFTLFNLTGCGVDDTTSIQTTNITVACETTTAADATPSQIATYHLLSAGDTVEGTPSGNVQIHTPVGESSRVCLIAGSGSAQILAK